MIIVIIMIILTFASQELQNNISDATFFDALFFLITPKIISSPDSYFIPVINIRMRRGHPNTFLLSMHSSQKYTSSRFKLKCSDTIYKPIINHSEIRIGYIVLFNSSASTVYWF